MNINELVPGDLLLRRKDPTWHRGIYLGNGQVLHNAPEPPGGESITSFANFSKGETVYVWQPSLERRAEITQRAWHIITNPKAYSYLWRNCEHTFFEITEGTPRSPTVRTLVSLAAVAGVGILPFKYRKEIAQAVRGI